jgi:hypothetical protein
LCLAIALLKVCIVLRARIIFRVKS